MGVPTFRACLGEGVGMSWDLGSRRQRRSVSESCARDLVTSQSPPPPPGCNCESDFTDGTCEDLTGRCYCRPNFTGERCDACAEGFAGFPLCYREGQPRGWGWGGPVLLSVGPGEPCRGRGPRATTGVGARGVARQTWLTLVSLPLSCAPVLPQ
jgi:hypothetical protein